MASSYSLCPDNDAIKKNDRRSKSGGDFICLSDDTKLNQKLGINYLYGELQRLAEALITYLTFVSDVLLRPSVRVQLLRMQCYAKIV